MINLNSRDPRPIYEQIKDQFRKLILSGVLKEDEKMPSVRDLATSLSINPNTIQRAYRELEADGYIYSIPARGSYVSGSTDAAQGRRKELYESLRKVIDELKISGAESSEILNFTAECLREEEDRNDKSFRGV